LDWKTSKCRCVPEQLPVQPPALKDGSSAPKPPLKAAPKACHQGR
jgi:hypothetical protein